jgi:uncharacterized protein YjbJ (UPF0337 family)
MIMAITPNKDQVKGELKDLGGKIQEEAGKLVGSKKQQAKGLQRQAEGKLQKGVGDLERNCRRRRQESIKGFNCVPPAPGGRTSAMSRKTRCRASVR